MVTHHGPVPLLPFLILIVPFAGLPVLFIAGSVVLTTRRDRANAGAHRARAGRLGGMLVGAVAGVAAVFMGYALLAPALVGAGYLFGVLAGEVARAPGPDGTVRAASLAPRDARRYLPRWVLPVTVASGALVLFAPVVFAVAPRPAGAGLWPPAALTVPLAVTAALGLAAGAMLIRRIAAIPQPAGADLGAAASGGSNAARAVAAAVFGIQLFLLGDLVMLASGGVGSVTSANAMGPLIMTWAGLGLALAGLVTWAVLSRWRREGAGPPPSARAAAQAP